MSALKMFHFEVTNELTKETISFKGQGKTLKEAADDGCNLVASSFDPKASGQTNKPGEPNGPILCAVKTKDGVRVSRPLRDFEGDVPFGGPAPVVPSPKPRRRSSSRRDAAPHEFARTILPHVRRLPVAVPSTSREREHDPRHATDRGRRKGDGVRARRHAPDGETSPDIGAFARMEMPSLDD